MLFCLRTCVSIFDVMVVIQDENFVYAYFFVIWDFVVVYICFVRSLVWVFGINHPSSVTLFMMLNKILFHRHLNCSVWAESLSSHLYFLFMRIFFFSIFFHWRKCLLSFQLLMEAIDLDRKDYFIQIQSFHCSIMNSFPNLQNPF